MIKVMIADDQELIRESLKIVLSTHEDIDVVDTASDGFEVLKCLEKYVVDVILNFPADGQHNIFFIRSFFPDGSGIFTAMPGINDDDLFLF